jgi:hypothetical protein
MAKQANLIQLLRRIPPKWALAILSAVLLYWLGQPILNRSFGLSLPTIANILGEVQRSSETEPSDTTATSTEYAPIDEHASAHRNFLTEVGPDRYRSPAGLVYTRGSEDGHRLKHLAKHLDDQPTRPGSHGVFDGDLTQVLRTIDEAYQRARNGDRNARMRNEEESTIYEATFEKAIGYVGGRDGKRKGNPPTKRIRIVVIGQNVITAFPY